MLLDHNIRKKAKYYYPQLMEDVQYKDDLSGKPKESNKKYLQRMDRIADEIEKDVLK